MRTFRRATLLFCATSTLLGACAAPPEREADQPLTPQARPSQPEAAVAITPVVTSDAATPVVSAPFDAGPRSVPPPGTSTSTFDAAAPAAPSSGDADLPPKSVDTSDAALPPSDAGTLAASCQGKPGARRGKSNHTLMAGGARRSFVYYAPKNLDPNKPAPLVIIPHGTNMSGQGMYDITRYAALADREGLVAIFPDGASGPGSFVPWNVGSGVCGLGAVVAGSSNDQPFIEELIKFAEQDQCIDGRHIFMTGFSMGGYFSHETACLTTKLAAIGPHSAGTHDLSRCAGKRLPVIMFHFTSDSLIDYGCGAEARDHWVKRNGCTKAGPEIVSVKGGKCEYYKNCMPNAQVAFCSFDPPSFADDGLPSGHGWSGGAKQGGESFAAISGSESSTELGWAFFKKYAW